MKIRLDGEEPKTVESFRLQIGKDEYELLDRGDGVICIYYLGVLSGKKLAVLPESGNVVKLATIR